MWTEMTIQLEIKKKDETEHLPIKNIYIYEIYHKCKSILPLNKQKIIKNQRLIKKDIFQAIKIKYTVRTVSKSNIDITEKDKIDIPITQIHGLCSFFSSFTLNLCTCCCFLFLSRCCLRLGLSSSESCVIYQFKSKR